MEEGDVGMETEVSIQHDETMKGGRSQAMNGSGKEEESVAEMIRKNTILKKHKWLTKLKRNHLSTYCLHAHA